MISTSVLNFIDFMKINPSKNASDPFVQIC